MPLLRPELNKLAVLITRLRRRLKLDDTGLRSDWVDKALPDGDGERYELNRDWPIGDH